MTVKITDQDMLDIVSEEEGGFGGGGGAPTIQPIMGTTPATQQVSTKTTTIRPIQPLAELTSTPGPSTTTQVTSQKPTSNIDMMAQELRLESPGGGISGIPEYQSNLKEIWNGFRQGTASIVDSLDAVTNLVSKATGLEKGKVFEQLRDYINPTPEELADKNFGPTLLRAIGQAGPIIAEFAVGTKGAGKLLTMAKIPKAIAGIATAPVAGFGAIEGITAAGHGEPALEVLKATGKGMGMGLGLGVAGKFRPLIQVPGTAGIFGGMAALEGADTQDIAVQTLVGLGFGAHGAWKSTRGMDTMRDYLAKNGGEPDVISKMSPNKLRNEYIKTMKGNMSDFLVKSGMSQEDVTALPDETLEDLFRKRVAEEQVKGEEKRKETKQEAIGAAAEVNVRNRQRYIDFLETKGFNKENLANVSRANLSNLSMLPDSRLYAIDPVTGDVTKLKTKAARKIMAEMGKSTEELQKQVATAPSKADKEKAQAELANKEVAAAKIQADIDKITGKDTTTTTPITPADTSADETAIKLKMQHAATEINEDWALEDKQGVPLVQLEQFENVRRKYGIPDEKKGDFFKYLQDNGIKMAKPMEITDTDMATHIEKELTKPEVIEDERIPSRVMRAFKDKSKFEKWLNEDVWKILTPEQKDTVIKQLNVYYDRTDKRAGAERKWKEWNDKKKELGSKIGAPPKDLRQFNEEWRIRYRNQATASLNSLRSFLRKSNIKLAAEGAAATTEEVIKKTRPKSALIKFSKPSQKALVKLGWDMDELKQLTSQDDVKSLLRDKLGPDDVNIDIYGRIERPDVKIANERSRNILTLIDSGTDDSVLKSMGYGIDEIDSGRKRAAEMGLGQKAPIPVEQAAPAKVVPEVTEVKAPKGKKQKGLITTLDQAEMVYDRYKDMSLEGEEVGAAEDIAIKRIQLKRALENFVGKKNLSDAQLEEELAKLAQKEAKVPTKEVTPAPKTTGNEIVTGYDDLPQTKKDALDRLGWSEESLRKVENPTIFDRINNEAITPDLATITDTGKLFVFGKGSPEIGYGEKVRKDNEELIKEGFGEDKIIANIGDLESELLKRGPIAKPDTGEANPDELLTKAYTRARKPTPLDETKDEYIRVSKRIYNQTEQMAKLELELKKPDLEPRLREMYSETLGLLESEMGSITAEYEAMRQTYSDMKEGAGITPERFAGPLAGEVKIERPFTIEDGTGALFVSEGGQGVDRFYALQTPDGRPAPADSTGNKIGVELRIVKDLENPSKLELKVFNSSPNVNPIIEDELLKTAINKYMVFGKEKIRKVSRVPGVADDVWDRRGDIESTLRKPADKVDSQSNLKDNIDNNSRLHRYVSYITRLGRGAKEWKEDYSKRADLLEQLSTLKQAADPQQFDPERFRSEVFPEHERMLGMMELIGDPTNSKIPIIRYITQKIGQVELQSQYLSNGYMDYIKKTFSPIFGNNPDMQKTFWNHVHKVKTSTDPIILDTYKKYRMYKEDINTVLKLKERGMYLDEYGTIRYDMDKIWKIMKEPFELASSYEELGDSMKASLSNDSFAQVKSLSDTYKTWDKIPKPSQEWLQQNLFNFQGVWSHWAYLPSFLQTAIPKKFFVESMQARTAGDAYKAALKYDFFDIERGYVLSTVKGALMNDALQEIRPLINSLPNASKFGSVRNYLEKYVKTVAGQKPTLLDPMWNNLANRINETMQASVVPLYIPTTIQREYLPQLYRGLLGPDTALRNLTQTIYTMAKNGPSNTLKGVLRYVDERRTGTPEYQKFEQMISLPDEFLEISRPIIPKGGDRSILDKMIYVNTKLTKAALWPMRLTEHINKGIAYFAGLEEAAAKGYNMNEAHIVGTAKASQLFQALEMTEGQYKALRSMYETQFGYSSAHTSPYLQGAGIKMFTPFWSFPIKTAQLMWNNALVNPIGGKTILGKSDYAWLRFMALTGFMATAPIVTANLFGVDTANIWGKGLFPMTIYPAWMSAIGNIYKMGGSDPGDFMDREKATNYMLQFVGQITVPGFRWGSKVYRDSLNAERGYREYGREQRPLVETSWLDEVADMMGFPPAKLREARETMSEYKDEKFKNMIHKHYYLSKAVDSMESKDYNEALNIIKEAKTEYNIDITSTEVQQAINKKKEDIWDATRKGAPKAIRTQPEFQQKMTEAKGKFMPSKARSYGTKPMWSSLSESLGLSEENSAPITLEE